MLWNQNTSRAAVGCFLALTIGCEDDAGGLVAQDGAVPGDGAPNRVDADGGGDAAADDSGCPSECSGHGTCVGAACQCELGYIGAGCADCAPGWQPGSGGSCERGECSQGIRCGDEEVCHGGACCECVTGMTICSNGAQRHCMVDQIGCGTWSVPVGCPGTCDTAERCVLHDGVVVEQFGSAAGNALEGLVALADGTPVIISNVNSDFEGHRLTDVLDFVVSARGDARRGQRAWTRAFSTSMSDFAGGLAYVDGYLYVAGYSSGSLGGQALGHYDAFAAKLGEDGMLVWDVQWGSNHLDATSGIASDQDGNVFVHGATLGNLGGLSPQSSNVYVTMLDPSGMVSWSTQWGSELDDISGKVAAGLNGDVYAAGCLSGSLGYIAKIAPNGQVDWVYEVGSTGCVLDVLVLSNGDILAAGRGSTPMLPVEGEGATFVVRLTEMGELVWARRTRGTTHRIALAGDTLYLGGRSLEIDGLSGHKGRGDAFVSAQKLSTGEVLWTKQFGTVEEDNLMGLAVASDGTVYAAGETTGKFPGYTHRNVVADLWLARILP